MIKKIGQVNYKKKQWKIGNEKVEEKRQRSEKEEEEEEEKGEEEEIVSKIKRKKNKFWGFNGTSMTWNRALPSKMHRVIA